MKSTKTPRDKFNYIHYTHNQGKNVSCVGFVNEVLVLMGIFIYQEDLRLQPYMR